MRKIEYSQIVRQKLKNLRIDLSKYGEDNSQNQIKKMLSTIKNLGNFSESGVRISEMYNIETDYYYIFVNHNYFIYRIEADKVIIVNMFNEKEDFMMKLFRVSGRTQESIDFWGE